MPLTVATLGSHSALQILKGARDEALRNLVVATHGRDQLYRRYAFVDEVVAIPTYERFPDAARRLAETDSVLVPHGSFVAYLGADGVDALTTPYYGNKAVLRWEADRAKQREWLEHARITVPDEYADPEAVTEFPVLIKRHGAPGGAGCRLVGSPEALRAALEEEDPDDVIIQQYVVGVTLYIHYFQSLMEDRLEILSMDRRYETTVDGLGRLPHRFQAEFEPEPGYVVVANSPLVLRESMLEEAYRMGEAVVRSAEELVGGGGLWGPFCLETIITPDLNFHVMEISCRIVAGTNVFVDGSPYAAMWFDEPMSTGRRIARELKRAAKGGRLGELLDQSG